MQSFISMEASMSARMEALMAALRTEPLDMRMEKMSLMRMFFSFFITRFASMVFRRPSEKSSHSLCQRGVLVVLLLFFVQHGREGRDVVLYLDDVRVVLSFFLVRSRVPPPDRSPGTRPPSGPP